MSMCLEQHVNEPGARFCTMCGRSLAPASSALPIAGASSPAAGTGMVNGSGTAELPRISAARSSSPSYCWECGGRWEGTQLVCRCGGLRPLFPGHSVDPSLFQWSLDGQAMAKLRSVGPLMSAAKSLSQRVGRPWIEATFNGVRLSERQLPAIYAMAVQAARLLGLRRMPNIYLSGERPWSALTFGSERDAFVVMGSALVSSFQKSELIFLFAREMGHILAGHALWKTVIHLLVGEPGVGAGMMRQGVAGLLDPTRLIEGAIELPLLGWARQAEITADRAGLLVAGSWEQAQKVLMMWALKSPVLQRQINLTAWLEQQEQDTHDQGIRLAELVTSATPYLTRRLKLMREYEASLLVGQFRQAVLAGLQSASVSQAENSPSRPAARPIGAAKTVPSPVNSSPGPSGRAANSIRVTCSACQRSLRVALPAPPSGPSEPTAKWGLRCPHVDCRQPLRIQASKAGGDMRDKTRAELIAQTGANDWAGES